MEEALNEKLFKFIEKEVKKKFIEAKEYEDTEACDDMAQVLLLCKDLLETDYYERSEKILDELDFTEPGKCMKIKKRWERAYKIDRSNKKKDVERLFNLLSDHLEEWC